MRRAGAPAFEGRLGGVDAFRVEVWMFSPMGPEGNIGSS